MSRRIEVTGVGTEIFVAPQHQCSQRIIPEEIEISVTSAVAIGATSIPVAATTNTQTILAPVWLDVMGPDGSELTVCVAEDIAPGATSLAILLARLAIPAGSTAIYPPKMLGALTANIEPTGELDTTVPLDQGGKEVSAYTTTGATVSTEYPRFQSASEHTIDWARLKNELLFIKILLPNATCPDDDSYIDRAVRSGFFLIEGGIPTPLEGGTPIRHSVNFKLDGDWHEYSNTFHLTPAA